MHVLEKRPEPDPDMICEAGSVYGRVFGMIRSRMHLQTQYDDDFRTIMPVGTLESADIDAIMDYCEEQLPGLMLDICAQQAGREYVARKKHLHCERKKQRRIQTVLKEAAADIFMIMTGIDLCADNRSMDADAERRLVMECKFREITATLLHTARQLRALRRE